MMFVYLKEDKLPEYPIIFLNLKYLIMFSHMHLPFFYLPKEEKLIETFEDSCY